MATKKKIGVKLPPLHLACSNDDLRPNLKCVYIKDGFATVTNGFLLIKYDLKDILSTEVLKELDGKLINRKVWERMCKTIAYGIIERNGQVICLDGEITILVTFVDQPYPDANSVFTKAFKSVSRTDKTIFSFNPGQIEIVSKIFGYEEKIHSLQIDQREKHLVLICANTNAIAVLAPVDQFVTLDVPSKFISA